LKKQATLIYPIEKLGVESVVNCIAHRDEESGREQSLREHLTGTAKKAEEFSAVIGAPELGRLCGLLHDIGKYSVKFQRRIRGSNEKVDHSTAGALEAMRLRNVPAAFCIAGHHSGLPDLGNRKTALPEDGTFYGKISRKAGRDIEDYSAYSSEIAVQEAKIPENFAKDNQSAFFFIRMLYSCLVDADYLDTEKFVSNGRIVRGGYAGIEELAAMLDRYISPWWDAKNELNEKRTKILRACLGAAGADRGLFALTVPTGGGKTVSSMAFALNHAKRHGMMRVIYVIPYTSIIEQTQSVFEEIFGVDNVVAHYANVDYDTGEDVADRRRLATENWDAPVILTTAVQFFESLYANRPSRCRKLHNIASSVIVFDEAQMLPPACLLPCVSAISQLVKNYGCSTVLCTATQPSLGPLFERFLPGCEIREICPQDYTKDKVFRRVTFVNEGFLDNRQLVSRLNAERQALCIVNNRRQAQEIFSLLEGEGKIHLSTLMYPAHRRKMFEIIRNRLRPESNLPCRVISTSLVEAGVDLDFPTVYRAYAGLDSMIQAAGRCNREGKRHIQESRVHLFQSEGRAPVIIRQNIAAAERTMRQFEDISSPEAIKSYFDFLYYTLKDEAALDAKGILADIDRGAMPFASVAERFRIIDSPEFTVYIPLEEGADLVKELKTHGMSRRLLRKLGQYSVGVYPRHFENLVNTGAVDRVAENAAVLRDLSLYSMETGLRLETWEGQAFIT